MRRSVALGCAVAIVGASAFGAVAASAGDGTTTVASARDAGASASETVDPAEAAAVDELVSLIDSHDGPTITSGLSVAEVPFTGGTQVTVTGEELDQVASVTVADVPAAIVALDASQVTFAVPAVAENALGSVEVRFADVAGEPVDVEAPGASVAAGASVPTALTTELPGIVHASTQSVPHALTLAYTTNPAIDAQVGYVLTYWSGYNTAQYTVLSGVDCANFVSQSLIARGWAMDGEWYYDAGTGAMGGAWGSSTAFRDYVLAHPERATELDDSQRSLVKVGDIAQFDWDSSGDRDHTAVVTRVEHTESGTKVWVGGHTKDADFWDVDEALATGGGSVTYFSLT
ncbi:amidase domain-containing protein [Streptomyces sp. ISL-90]|nr:amidase domain-containing protein [Streptomyces sp. ISL-90]